MPLASFMNESPTFGSESLLLSDHSKTYQLSGYALTLGSMVLA